MKQTTFIGTTFWGIPVIVLSLALCLASCRSSAPAETDITDRSLCPVAEWDTAKAILMHTPGIELFDGIIHPTAGLFENYFNVDSAAAEHRHYIDLLRANGIRVYTVSDILQSMPIDTLRTLVEQVLHYDLTRLAPQDTAEVGNFYRLQTIRQMSREDLIRCLLLQPTVELSKVDNNTGYEAVYRHDALMNLYFTRDQSITTPRGQIICQMNSKQRAPETRIIRACYRALGITPVLEINGEGRLEGGDYLPAGKVSLIGCGMRTNREAIRQIMDADAFGHDTVVIVCDHKHWQMQMHLDTYFNLIDHNLCTMVSSRLYAHEGEPEYVTADIYARAIGEKTYRCIASQISFVQWLQQRGMTIIPIDQQDELHYANNYLTVAPRHIMAVGGQSEAFQKRLADAGVTVEWIPLEQLIDGYGAAHCMTQVLSRQPQQHFNTDLFYILSTNVTSSFDSNGKEVYNAVLTQDEKERMQQEIDFIKAQLGDSLNLFAPFYHQFTMNAVLLPNDSFAQAFDFAKRDIQRQFKHYLRHTNTDRPFFLAGFSQGAMFIPYLLREMSERDYQRCLGAYMMGYRLTRQDLLHHRIAVAHSELDGKVISFNSVTSPSQQWDFVSGNAAACINPLNWTTDGTPAVLFFNDDTIHIVQDTCSHLLLCDVNPDRYTLPGAEKWWEHGCLHHWDILFYNQALHDNMLKRARKYRQPL